MEENKDVDLYEELRKTLASSESSEEETEVASDQKPTTDETVEKPNEDENTELTEDDISKLSPRAQKRIREQAEEIKRLAESKAETPEKPQEEETPTPQDFKSVQEFLSAVEDEPSRKLLEKFYGVIKGEISSTLSPIEKANNEAKFENEFSKYEKIEGLADYKNDLKSTFLRNPNQSMKSLVGEIVTDLSLNKIKPIENKPSSPNRGEVNTDNLSKDQLYDMLDTLRI